MNKSLIWDYRHVFHTCRLNVSKGLAWSPTRFESAMQTYLTFSICNAFGMMDLCLMLKRLRHV